MRKEKSDQNAVAELTREWLYKENKWLWEENKKLKEFKNKREESMFYFKALAERVEPINSKEAEELQRYKKLFEKLYREELYYLEEENKKLKEDVERLIKLSEHKTTTIMGLWKNLDEVKEENKKLNIKVASLEWEIKWLNSVIDKLKEENQTLELWLDRKEKLNEKYRKELKNYVYDAKQVRDIC